VEAARKTLATVDAAVKADEAALKGVQAKLSKAKARSDAIDLETEQASLYKMRTFNSYTSQVYQMMEVGFQGVSVWPSRACRPRYPRLECALTLLTWRHSRQVIQLLHEVRNSLFDCRVI
jgi:hypothetical protein